MIAERSADNPRDYEVLLASVHYLGTFPIPRSLRPLLRRLEAYPYDGLVRDLASRLLERAE
jgi:hypothetical protein